MRFSLSEGHRVFVRRRDVPYSRDFLEVGPESEASQRAGHSSVA
jgi:hypothetical protein